MGTYLRVPSKHYRMNTNMARFRWFSKSFRPCALDESQALDLEGLKWTKYTHEYTHKYYQIDIHHIQWAIYCIINPKSLLSESCK